jgi:quinohemoprotein amine dehydrogenase
MNRTLLKLAIGVVLAVAGWNTANAFDKDSLVWKKCTGCHSPEDGQIARVEELRTTPEEWTVIVDRMHRLYKMPIGPGEMAALLKELSATQILSPEEAARVSYISLFNNPQTMEAPHGAEEERLFVTCVRCHSAAKIFAYRMTPDNWAKLRDFHLYFDPTIMNQMREMHWREEADKVLPFLAQNYAYGEAWKAPQANPAGQWLVLGAEPGKGSYRGKATLVSRGDGEFALDGSLDYADGTSETFTGEATLYGGYALRTRARQNGNLTMGAFSFVDGLIKGEHHHPAPDFRTSSSAWYPLTKKSQVLRLTPGYLLGGEETKVLVEGMNLPEVKVRNISASDAQVEVLQATRTGPESIELVLAYRGTGHGEASLKIKGLESPVLKLAPRIDFLTVSPATGRARINGGVNYPAEGVQFQALAWSRGADADDPQDDYQLGPVDAAFSLAEEQTRPGDDDLAYAGAIEADGTYLPIGDYHPIQARMFGAEGTGWIKVLATYQRGADAYTAEAKLAVTVPDFIQRIR